jgi:hypothetical protein
MSQINVDIVQPFTLGSDVVTVSGINISKPTVANPTHYNIAIGEGSLDALSSKENNIAIGKSSLLNLTGGGDNISIGYQAGVNLQTHPSIALYDGSNNVFIGNNAGATVVYGRSNTIIGWSSTGTSYLQGGTGNTLIGAGAIPSAVNVDNEFTLGGFSVAALRCNVTSITSLSDARDKKDITDLRAGLDFVKSLRPVEFVWDDRREEGKHDIADFGFIAQDLKSAQEDIEMADTLKLVYESNPERLEASYGKLVPVLVQAIKDLAAEVETLKNK